MYRQDRMNSVLENSELMQLAKMGNPDKYSDFQKTNPSMSVVDVENMVKDHAVNIAASSDDPDGVIAREDLTQMLTYAGVEESAASKIADADGLSAISGIDVSHKSGGEALVATAKNAWWNEMKGMSAGIGFLLEIPELTGAADKYQSKVASNPVVDSYGGLGDLALSSVQPMMSTLGFVATNALLSWLPGGLGLTTAAKFGAKAAKGINFVRAGLSQAGNTMHDVSQMEDALGNKIDMTTVGAKMLGTALVVTMGGVEMWSLNKVPGYSNLTKYFTGQEIKKHISKGVLNSIGKYTFDSLKSTVSEGIEEGVQRYLSAGYENLLKEIKNKEGAEFEMDSFEEVTKQAIQETKDATKSMFLTSFILGGATTGVYNSRVKAESKKNFNTTKTSQSLPGEFLAVPRKAETKDTKESTEKTTTPNEEKEVEKLTPIKGVVMKGRFVPTNETENEKAREAQARGAEVVEIEVSENLQMDQTQMIPLANKAAIQTGGKIVGENRIVYESEDDLNKAVYLLKNAIIDVDKNDTDTYLTVRNEDGTYNKLELGLATEEEAGVDPDLSYVENPDAPYQLSRMTQDRALEWTERETIKKAIGDVTAHTGGNISSTDLEANIDAVILVAKTVGIPTDELLKKNLAFELVTGMETPQAEQGNANISYKTDMAGQKKYTITVNNTANVGSLVHEVGHLLRGLANKDQLQDFVNHYGSGDTAIWLDDITETEDGKYKLGENVYDSYAQAKEVAAKYEETFADDFVTYIKTGEAPTTELQNIFRRMKAVLQKVFDRYGYKLDDDVVNAFNKLFSSEGNFEETVANDVSNKISNTLFETTDSLINQPEFDSIKNKYKDTDKWLLAPNGKVSNLDEKQWVQVRTQSFKDWFGDWENDPTSISKEALDLNGEPELFHHGSYTDDIEVFKLQSPLGYANNASRGGFSFTNKRDGTKGYAHAKDLRERSIQNYLDKMEKAFIDAGIEDVGALDIDEEVNSQSKKFYSLIKQDGGTLEDFAEEEMLPSFQYVYWDESPMEFIENRNLWSTTVPKFIKKEFPKLAQELKDAKKGLIYKGKSTPKIYDVFLKIPKGTKTQELTRKTLYKVGDLFDVSEEATGAYVVNIPNEEKVVYIANSSMVKSIDNKGTFDSNNDNILFEKENRVLYKNVDIADLENILKNGILPVSKTGNDNWDESKRVNNAKDSVYLFDTKSNGDSFVNYGLALIEVEVEATRNKMADTDVNQNKYIEYTTNEVKPSQIKNVYVPSFVNLPFTNNKIKKVSYNSKYQTENGLELLTPEIKKQFEATAIISTSEINYLRGLNPDKTMIDVEDKWEYIIPTNTINETKLYETVENKVFLEDRVAEESLDEYYATIEDIRDHNGYVDANGYVTLYHRTSSENAKKILKDGFMIAKEDGLFFSTKRDGENIGYGEAVVNFEIPIEQLEMDDMFNDEIHFRLPIKYGEGKDITEFVSTEEINEVVNKYKGTDKWLKAPNGKVSNLTEKQWVQVRTQAFKDWFGDWENDPGNASKILDENGEPLVVYHGAGESFETFDRDKFGSSNDMGFYGTGFYFSESFSEAEGYGDNVFNTFVNIKKPFDMQRMVTSELDKNREHSNMVYFYNIAAIFGDKDFNIYLEGESWTAGEFKNKIDEMAKETDTPFASFVETILNGDNSIEEESDLDLFYMSEELTNQIVNIGYDGVISEGLNNKANAEIVAYQSNQIKSVNNNGAFGSNNDNILFETAAPKDSKTFKAWFKNSQFVNADGTPRVGYHGTKSSFGGFETGYREELYFFSPNSEFASDWAIGRGIPSVSAEEDQKLEDLYYEMKAYRNKVAKKYGIDEILGMEGEAFEKKYVEMNEKINKDMLEKYGIQNEHQMKQSQGARVIPVYISAQKIFNPEEEYERLLPIMKTLNSYWDENNKDSIKYLKEGRWGIYETFPVVNKLKEWGYDAMWLRESGDGPLETLALFNNRQAKSIFNRGTWSEGNSNILYETAEDPDSQKFKAWFGKSKVVDSEGNPLLVFHGTQSKTRFTIFEAERGFNIDGIYHASTKSVASHWSGTSVVSKFKNISDEFEKLKTIEETVKFIEKNFDSKVNVKFEPEQTPYDINSSDPWLNKPIPARWTYDIDESSWGTFGNSKNLVKTEKEVVVSLKRMFSSEIAYAENATRGRGTLYANYLKIENPLEVDAKGKSYHNILFNGERVNTEHLVGVAKEQGLDGVIVKNVKETNYENILTDDYIVFDSTQIKSQDNQGTWNTEDPNILFETAAPIDSKEFKKFFEGSKVVDENGNPLVVNHGTPKGGFTEFKMSDYPSSLMSQQGGGYYFTDKKNAKQYMDNVNKTGSTKNKQLYDVYLSIKNPLKIKANSDKTISLNQYIDILKEGNYEWFFTNWIYFVGDVSKDVNRDEALIEYAKTVYNRTPNDAKLLSETVRAFKGTASTAAYKKVLDFDGVKYTDQHGDIWVAWDNTQIKSVDNQGTWNTEDPNILFEKADTSKLTIDENLVFEDPTKKVLDTKEKIAAHNTVVEIKQAFYDQERLTYDVIDSINDIEKLLLDGEDLPGYNYIEEYMEKIGENRTVQEIFEEQLEADNEIEKFMPVMNVFDLAIQSKGITKNVYEAGYVLPDGRMLDFSGKNVGGPSGQRAEDHRQLGLRVNEDLEGSDIMVAFQKLGAIRIDAQSGLIDMETLPTSRQFSLIKGLIIMNDETYVDLQDGNRRSSITNNASPNKIMGLIRRFYAGQDINKQTLLFETVSHGSPYSFDKMKTDKMNTGTGAQAFGWGLYLTQSPKVAEDYANATFKSKVYGLEENPYKTLYKGKEIETFDDPRDILEKHNGELTEEYFLDMSKYLIMDEKRDWLKQPKESSKVDFVIGIKLQLQQNLRSESLNAMDISYQDLEDLEDLEKPFKEQTPEEIEKFEERKIKYAEAAEKNISKWGGSLRNSHLLKHIEEGMFEDITIEAPNGIPGLKKTIYKVEIPNEGYLEWDESGEQVLDLAKRFIEYVSKIEPSELKKRASHRRKRGDIDIEGMNNDILTTMEYPDLQTIESLYATASFNISDKFTSEILNEMGYVGIKHPINGTKKDSSQRKWNYVMFNEDDVKILERKGVETNTLYELSDEAKTEVLENRKADVKKAIENYYWIPDSVLKEYETEDWAINEIKFRSYLTDDPSILEEAKDFTDENEFLEHLQTSEGMESYKWVEEDEKWFKRVHAYSRILTPKEKDSQFIRMNTVSQDKLLALANTLRGYEDVVDLSGSNTVVYKWGAFDGISPTVKNLSKDSTDADFEKAIALIEKNPSAYRKALQVIAQANDRVGQFRGMDEATGDSQSATREAYYDSLGEEMVELINPTQTESPIGKYTLAAKKKSLEAIIAEQEEIEEELKKLGAETEVNLEKTKKNLSSAKEYVKKLEATIEEEKTEIKKLETKLEKKSIKASQASTLARALKDRRARVKNLRTDLTEQNQNVRKLTKKNATLTKRIEAKKVREILNKMNARIKKATKFNSSTTDAKFEDIFNAIQRLFSSKKAGSIDFEESNYLTSEQNEWIRDGKMGKTWTLNDLLILDEAVKAMRADGRFMLDAKKTNRSNRLQNIALRMYQQTYGTMPEVSPTYGSMMNDIIEELMTKQHVYKENVFNAMLNTVKSSIGKMQRVARVLDGNTEGVMYDLLVRQAYENMTGELRESYRRLEEADAKMLELKITPDLLLKEGFKYISTAGQEIKLSKSEVIGLYVYSQNELGFQKLVHVNGNNINQYTIDKAIANLTDNEKAWGDYMIDSLGSDESWSRQSDVFYNVYNKNLGKRDRYFTFVGSGSHGDEGKADLINGTKGTVSRYVDKSFTHEVNPNAIYPLKLNVTSTFTSQVKKQEHFINWAEWVRDTNFLMDKGAIGRIIEMEHGPKYKTVVAGYVNDVGSPQTLMDDLDRLGSKVISNAAVAALSLNFLTMLKQLPSFSAAIRGDVGVVELLSVATRLMNPGTHTEAIKFIHEMSPYMRKRAISVEVEKYSATDFDTKAGRLVASFNNKIGMKGIYMMDQIAVNTLWLSAYDTYLRRNPKNLQGEELKKEAAFKATQLISESQPTSIINDLSSLQRKKGPFVRSALLFTNQMFQYVNMVWYDIPTSMKAYKATKDPQYMRKAFGSVMNMAISGALIILVSGAAFRKKDEDDDEYLKRMTVEVLKSTANYSIPLAGRSIAQGASGYSSGSIVQLPTSIGRLLGTDLTDLDKVSDRLWDILFDGGSISGLPTAFINRAIKSVKNGNAFELLGTNYGRLWENR